MLIYTCKEQENTKGQVKVLLGLKSPIRQQRNIGTGCAEIESGKSLRNEQCLPRPDRKVRDKMSGLSMRENAICGITGMLDNITEELEDLKRLAANEDYTKQDLLDGIDLLLSKLM